MCPVRFSPQMAYKYTEIINDLMSTRFSLFPIARLYLQVPDVRIQWQENRRISQRVNAIVHTGNGMGIAHGYCIELSVICTESERVAHFCFRNNRRCPLGLNHFNDLELESLCDFYFFQTRPLLVQLDIARSGLVANLQVIIRSYAGLPSSTQVPIPHGFEFR